MKKQKVPGSPPPPARAIKKKHCKANYFCFVQCLLKMKMIFLKVLDPIFKTSNSSKILSQVLKKLKKASFDGTLFLAPRIAEKVEQMRMKVSQRILRKAPD